MLYRKTGSTSIRKRSENGKKEEKIAMGKYGMAIILKPRTVPYNNT